MPEPPPDPSPPPRPPFDGLPEFARSLRALGSRRGRRHGRSEDRFFGPLLEARSRAAKAADRHSAVSAFDPALLVELLRETVRDFAGERFPDRPRARRAYEARLTEVVEPFRDALAGLERRITAVTTRDGDENAWVDWLAQVRVIFEAADRIWLALDAVIEDRPPPRRRWWRRTGPALFLAATTVARPVDAQHLILRVGGVRVDTLLAHGFDVVGYRNGDALVAADRVDRDRLAASGWRVTSLTPSSTSRAAPGDTIRVFRSFDDPRRGIRVYLDSLARVNSRVHVDSIGASAEGRPILVVKIGPADESAGRPNVLFMATYHAREWAAADLALRLIRYLATDSSARVDSLLQSRDIWVIPVANPDGYQFTFTSDRLWRKNRRPLGADPQGNQAYGVDLNRNHSEKWGLDNVGSSADPLSEVYRGPSPSSEPEIQAIERFHQRFPPITAVSYHTYAGELLFPPGFASGTLAGDLSVYRTLVGSDERPAVLDNLPGSDRSYSRGTYSWNLYPTNGEYTDWAYARFGTIAVTPELTTGIEYGRYYGFEFPDDEARLQTLFEDNRPFALEMLESARDPPHFTSRSTGIAIEPLVLESASPVVRIRAPASFPPTARAGAPLPLTSDTTGHGRYLKRWVSAPIGRVPRIDVDAGSLRVAYSVLTAGGAEPADTAWAANGMVPRRGGVAGQYEWRGTQGYVRSPRVAVPAGVDTVSVMYWTAYDGNGFSTHPHGEVRLSVDAGATWARVATVAGAAPAYYPERVVVGSVRGKTLQFEFSSPDGLPWQLDEILIVAHNPATLATTDAGHLRPSENPVKGDIVYFNWPFGAAAGDVTAYDYSGLLAWRASVAGGTESVTWDLRGTKVVNGVYLVVARSAGRNLRFKLFVTRRGGSR